MIIAQLNLGRCDLDLEILSSIFQLQEPSLHAQLIDKQPYFLALFYMPMHAPCHVLVAG